MGAISVKDEVEEVLRKSSVRLHGKSSVLDVRLFISGCTCDEYWGCLGRIGNAWRIHEERISRCNVGGILVSGKSRD